MGKLKVEGHTTGVTYDVSLPFLYTVQSPIYITVASKVGEASNLRQCNPNNLSQELIRQMILDLFKSTITTKNHNSCQRDTQTYHF